VALKHLLVLDATNAIDNFVYYFTVYTLSNRVNSSNGEKEPCIRVVTMGSKVVSRKDPKVSLNVKFCFRNFRNFRNFRIHLSENLLSHKPQMSEVHAASRENLN
jgi:hypothetical protein